MLQPLPVAESSTRFSLAASVGAVGATGRCDSILPSAHSPYPSELPHLRRPHEALPSSSQLLRAARHRVQLHHPVRVQQGGHHRYQGYGRRHLSPTKLPIALPRALACRKACGLSPSGLAPRRPVGAGCFFSWHVCVDRGLVWRCLVVNSHLVQILPCSICEFRRFVRCCPPPTLAPSRRKGRPHSVSHWLRQWARVTLPS